MGIDRMLAAGRILVVVGLLSGCALSGISSSATYYTVQPGDTVYSIAWSAGVDYHRLAEWNDIAADFTIRPGQRLRIRPPAVRDSRRVAGSSRAESTTTEPRPYYRVRKGDTLYSIARKNKVSVGQLGQWNGLGARANIYPGQKLWLTGDEQQVVAQSSPPSNSHRKRTPVTRASRNSAAPAQNAVHWSWPVRGTISAGYDQKAGRKGINIDGAAGSPIRAAAAGTIVYQGSGLRGYGRLIIVKHNNDFLSAYAHCDSFLLKEGSKVKRGAVIAKLGSTGTDRNQLHFEIRYQGNPVNPLGYLPRI